MDGAVDFLYHLQKPLFSLTHLIHLVLFPLLILFLTRERADVSLTARIDRRHQLSKFDGVLAGGQRAKENIRPSSLHPIFARQQLLNFRNNLVGRRHVHIADPLPADDSMLINHIHIGNKLSPTVQLIRHLGGI